MDTARIVGIVLARNEDLNIARVLWNIVDFCDEILVADHASSDGTAAEIARFAAAHPAKTRSLTIAHPRESHELLHPYEGTRTWVFAADGDEIYDPQGLRRFRRRLLCGEFDRHWTIFGNVLNCVSLDMPSLSATGHLSPPCRSMTKLHNFNAIDSWRGDTPERLHGGAIRFREGYSNDARRHLHIEVGWRASDYRCLHLCFLPRSSKDPEKPAPRPNIMELYGSGIRAWFARHFLRRRSATAATNWKMSRYMRGPRIEESVADFFPAIPLGPCTIREPAQ